MRFVCQKDKLSSAVSIVSKAASVKSTISALEGIKAEIKDGLIKLSAYDFTLAISASFEADVVEVETTEITKQSDPVKLSSIKRDAADDGSVVDGQNAGEKSLSAEK